MMMMMMIIIIIITTATRTVAEPTYGSVYRLATISPRPAGTICKPSLSTDKLLL
jgi:hypothetical protein